MDHLLSLCTNAKSRRLKWSPGNRRTKPTAGHKACQRVRRKFDPRISCGSTRTVCSRSARPGRDRSCCGLHTDAPCCSGRSKGSCALRLMINVLRLDGFTQPCPSESTECATRSTKVKVAPREVGRIATWTGKHLALHCTAVRKALAASLPEEQLDMLIREQGQLRHNDNTISRPRALSKSSP